MCYLNNFLIKIWIWIIKIFGKFWFHYMCIFSFLSVIYRDNFFIFSSKNQHFKYFDFCLCLPLKKERWKSHLRKWSCRWRRCMDGLCVYLEYYEGELQGARLPPSGTYPNPDPKRVDVSSRHRVSLQLRLLVLILKQQQQQKQTAN